LFWTRFALYLVDNFQHRIWPSFYDNQASWQISSKSVDNFLSYLANKQKDKQKDRLNTSKTIPPPKHSLGRGNKAKTSYLLNFLYERLCFLYDRFPFVSPCRLILYNHFFPSIEMLSKIKYMISCEKNMLSSLKRIYCGISNSSLFVIFLHSQS